jgi:hypothetical protein
VKARLVHSERPAEIYSWVLTREDLEGQELEIYEAVITRLDNPRPELHAMAAAYSYAASEFKKAANNPALAAHLRRCMVYCRNRLGPWQPKPISSFELLLEYKYGWPVCYMFCNPDWEVT